MGNRRRTPRRHVAFWPCIGRRTCQNFGSGETPAGMRTRRRMRDERACESGRHRRGRRRMFGPLPPRPGRLDRRRPDRAIRTHLRLFLACGRRLSYAQRRSQRRQAPGLHGQALQGDRGTLGTILRVASDRRRHAGRQPRTHGFPAPRPCQGPLPGHGDGTDHALRGEGDVPADGRDELRRCAVGPGGRPSRPLRHHPRLCQGRARARRGDRAQEPRRRADAGTRRHMARGHRARHDHCRARRQCRRSLGAGGRAHGRPRAAGARHGAYVSPDRTDARGRGLQCRDRTGDGRRARLQG